MASRSIALNGHKWAVKLLGENAVLLEAQAKLNTSAIHETTALIEAQQLKVLDIVPAYTSIALIVDRSQTDVHQLINKLKNIRHTFTPDSSVLTTHHIPVNYEKGLDWLEITQQTKRSKSEIIEKHIAVAYRVAMMGFLPGFIYLEGMDEALNCPRKINPRTRVPAGAVGIGGKQTGIYALASPGGWQIIGQTDITLFDPKQLPPNQLNVGDTVRFFVL